MLSAWERWAAQLLETHISYPQLAYYRSQHSNQSWLGSLVTILDSTSLLLARDGAAPNSQARAHVRDGPGMPSWTSPRFSSSSAAAAFAERLPPATAARLREALAATPLALPPSSGFESRLAELRLKYEPYAQALASDLMIELPPWIHDTARPDNWQGGPWDRQLAPHREPAHRTDEHF